jgi:hypothetical protein
MFADAHYIRVAINAIAGAQTLRVVANDTISDAVEVVIVAVRRSLYFPHSHSQLLCPCVVFFVSSLWLFASPFVPAFLLWGHDWHWNRIRAWAIELVDTEDVSSTHQLGTAGHQYQTSPRSGVSVDTCGVPRRARATEV